MARPLRLQLHDTCYHVMARGNARQAIFVDDIDRQQFLITLRTMVDRLDWAVVAYCLMPNHYHVLVQTRLPNLARGMRDLNGAYSQYFNRRHDRVGHLFQGRYKAPIVEETGCLFGVARYIVLNPVRAHLCAAPEEWPWSSYGPTAGVAPSPVPISHDLLMSQFGGPTDDAREAYARFVRAGIGLPEPRSRACSTAVIGSTAFARGLAPAAAGVGREVPRRERSFMSLDDHARRAGDTRGAMRAAYASGVYSIAQIARHFGVSYSTVSRTLRTFKNERAREIVTEFKT